MNRRRIRFLTGSLALVTLVASRSSAQDLQLGADCSHALAAQHQLAPALHPASDLVSHPAVVAAETGVDPQRAALRTQPLVGELTDDQRASLADAFAGLDLAGRTAAWPSLLRFDDERVLRAALDRCVEVATDVLLASPSLSDLARLDERRASLNLLRSDALRAIFDEQDYFFPYAPPEPPRRRSDYVRAQRQVDQLVDAVRVEWSGELSVALPRELRRASADLRWTLELGRVHALGLTRPRALPEYLLALPEELEQLSVREFARTPLAAQRLDLGRRIRALNARAFEQSRAGVPGFGLASIPDAEEREMIRRVNDYRVMLGRLPMAWDERLQAASQGHSDYMRANTYMGHLERDPTRRTVADRAALVGYRGSTAENCVQHDGGPELAFIWWVHSSAHHRNLLVEAHRDLGAARAQDWWTLDMGRGLQDRESLNR